MADKCFKTSSHGTLPLGCCDMSIKCRFMWRRDHDLLPCSSNCCCTDKPQSPPCCFLLPSSSMMFLFGSLLLFASLGFFFAWLTFSPFAYSSSMSFDPSSSHLSCRPDNEGSWSIGIFFGDDPFSLQPIELAMTSQTFKGTYTDDGPTSTWPVANPILTCASVVDWNHPSTFVADPFLYIQGSKLYIFFETKNALTNKGEIGVAESADGGASWKYLGIALEEEWHLSFPYVFDYNGEIYMMPEGSKKGDLRLYRAAEFPLRWAMDRVLIKRPLVDAVMLEHGGRFWILGSDNEQFGAVRNGELEAWHAASPLGPWRPHRGNPVVNGGRGYGARNGGRPFVHGGQLYRVGQDCGGTYGRRLRVFRVEALSPDDFREAEVPWSFAGGGGGGGGKGRNAWNGVRHHQLDAQRLPSGGWIAAMDGDRVPSGELAARRLAGGAALLGLLLLVLLSAVVLGHVRCAVVVPPPLGKCLAVGRPGWMPVQAVARLHRVVSRLNRGVHARGGGGKLRGCCAGAAALAAGATLACVAVRALLGGNGAAQPYAVAGRFSQFTMVAMTHEARLWNLRMYVAHYSRCASVREIVVVWNRGRPPAAGSLGAGAGAPVRVRVEPRNSLNNRFRPDARIATRAVLQLDDDIMMTCDDLERGFAAWRAHPARIVGFYPRLVDGSPLKYRNERYARAKRGYNLILTGAAFLDWRPAFAAYWAEGGAAERGRALVDQLFNCEDILLNYVLANASSFPSSSSSSSSPSPRTVEYIHPAWALDTSKLSSSAISRDTGLHYLKRDQCLRTFSELYPGLVLNKWEFGNRSDGWDY